MRASRTYGSMRGAPSNGRPYRNREKGWSFDGSLSSAPFKSRRVSTKTTRFLHEGPMVRIRLPPAESLRTIGPARSRKSGSQETPRWREPDSNLRSLSGNVADPNRWRVYLSLEDVFELQDRVAVSVEGKRAQVEVLGGEVGRRPRGGTAHLGGL